MTHNTMTDKLRAAAEQAQRCLNCDDTGDVTSHTGEWRGVCHCQAGDELRSIKRKSSKTPPQPAPAPMSAEPMSFHDSQLPNLYSDFIRHARKEWSNYEHLLRWGKFVADKVTSAAPVSAEPAAWIEGPHGAIRANPTVRYTGPTTVSWSVPLYESPQPAPVPLTESQIWEIAQTTLCQKAEWAGGWNVAFTRAIERAHGIGDAT